jgi:hypothetical protein
MIGVLGCFLVSFHGDLWVALPIAMLAGSLAVCFINRPAYPILRSEKVPDWHFSLQPRSVNVHALSCGFDPVTTRPRLPSNV